MAPLPRLSADLAGRTFDLLVLGGGINGTGVARDAARRGLSVALVEKEDFGYGTTGRSTRLIHGGLRYLAMGDVGLVRESLRERERLLENAGHLVRPLTFLIPFYKGQRTPPWMLKVGLQMYDALAASSRIPHHCTYSKEQILEMEPGLRGEGLRGGASYGDGQVELVERLCIENALDAAAHGALLLNHARVDRIAREGDVTAASVSDLLGGGRLLVRARRVVNTTGPWLDRVSGLPALRSRMTKGVHLVTPQATRHAVLLFSPDDDRVFFSIPWLGHQLVGTTDTDFTTDPDAAHADADDVEYLQRGIRQALPHADVATVHYTWAGIRNLVPEEGKSESDVSRKHQLLDHAAQGLPGVLSLVGGKITPYRAVCEEVVDRIARGLRATRVPRSDTHDAPLPGAPADLDALVHRLEVRAGELRLPPGVARTLATTYGTRAHLVLDRVQADPAQGRVLCPHAPLLLAEVPFVVETEMARTSADVLLRRTRCGWEPCEGRDALPAVLDALDAMLGRDAKARAADEAGYRDELAKLDLDGTLIHPAIFNVVADALGFGAPLQDSYKAYVDGRMSLEEAFHHDYRHFVGRDVASMHAALRGSQAWTPGIAEAVARLQDAGLKVVVTTDQPRFLAETTRWFGVDDLVCSEAEVRHGRVTGEVHPSFEKWPNLERHLNAWRIDPKEVAHVGNGTNDIPVFRRVGFSVGVNALSPTVYDAASASVPKLESLDEVADIILARMG